MRVLVTGATGYVGGRLVPRLLEKGHQVRVLVRDETRLPGRPWAGRVEVVRGSLEDEGALRRALEGVEAAYYLVRAMLSEGPFQEAERRQAEAFARVAREAGLSHTASSSSPSPGRRASRRALGRGSRPLERLEAARLGLFSLPYKPRPPQALP